jgi:AcrR family transcriptional regulator
VPAALQSVSYREQRKQQTVEAILAASRQLFAEQGYESTTIDRICEQAQISRMTFYKHFPSKLSLLDALCDVIFFQELDRLLASARAQSENTITQMRLFLEGMAARLQGFSSAEWMLLREGVKGMARDDDKGAWGWAFLRKCFTSLFDEGQEKGHITRACSADLLLEVIDGTVSSVSLNWVYDMRYPSHELLYKLSDFITVALRKTPD